MAKTNIMEMIYKKMHTNDEISFDDMQGPSVYNLFTMQDIYELNKIATSAKLSGNLKKKLGMIDSIMKVRGFRKFAGGTNRVVYTSYEIPNIVVKVAIDKVGMRDNPAEMLNQHFLKPFVAKMFSVSQDGVIAVCEKIIPITNLTEFGTMADMIFEIIVKKILREFIIDDIGIKYFLNWGYRFNGFPCLLDYPYLYRLDPSKLYCKKNNGLTNYTTCGGEIDYDGGFNHLVCKKCGTIYRAADIGFDLVSELDKYIYTKGDKTMKVSIYMNDGRVITPMSNSDYIQKPMENKKVDNRPTIDNLSNLVCVEDTINDNTIENKTIDNDSSEEIIEKIEELKDIVEDQSDNNKVSKETDDIKNDITENMEDSTVSAIINNSKALEGYYVDQSGRLRDEKGRYVSKNKKEKLNYLEDEYNDEEDFSKKSGKKKYKSYDRKNSIKNIEQF